MPCTIIRNSTQPGGAPSTAKIRNYLSRRCLHGQDGRAGPQDGIVCVHVTFLPGARTFWHSHEKGQILEVKAGSGWVCDKGGVPQRIRVGDIVTCPAGTTHWHGAEDGCMLVHLAIGLGKTTWLEEVSAAEYASKAQSA